MLFTILASTIPIVSAGGGIAITSPTSGTTYKRGDTVTVSAVSYAGDEVWALQIQRGSTVVWIEKGESSDAVTYNFEIPSTWSGGTYTIYIDGDVSDPQSTTFYLSVPTYLPSSTGGTTTTPPTPEEVEEQSTDDAIETLNELSDNDAADILVEINKTKAKTILEAMDEEDASDLVKAAVDSGDTDDIAIIIDDMDDEKGANILLNLDTTYGAPVVERMAAYNLNEAAKTVEEAVKKRLQETDPDKATETLSRIANILDGTSTESLVDIFVEIANLPQTPSTVATVMSAMQLTKVYDVVTAWITVGDLEELGLVYSYFETDFLETVYLGMTTEQRNALFPYLTAETIAALPELSEFQIKDLTITPETVETGEIVTITATAENIGIESGSYVVNLKIDDITEETEQLTLTVGEEETLTWTITKNTAATYSVDVNGETGSFTVEAPPLEPANIVYNSISVAPTSMETGESATVTVTLENTGEEAGTELVELYIDDEMIDSETVTVAGGATETAVFTVTKDTAGEYTVEAGDKSTTFTVTEPEVTEPPSSFPWTYVGLAVVIIAAAAYIYMQQQKQ